MARPGKLACPRVNVDQKIDVDDQKLNFGRPHDYWILENLFYKILFILLICLAIMLCKRYALEDDQVLNLSSPDFQLNFPSLVAYHNLQLRLNQIYFSHLVAFATRKESRRIPHDIRYRTSICPLTRARSGGRGRSLEGPLRFPRRRPESGRSSKSSSSTSLSEEGKV